MSIGRFLFTQEYEVSIMYFFPDDPNQQQRIAIDTAFVESVEEGFRDGRKFATITLCSGDRFAVDDSERTTADMIRASKALALSVIKGCLELEVGDILVVHLSDVAHKRLSQSLGQTFQSGRVVVLEEGMMFSVLRNHEAGTRGETQ